jgi:uncharacterized membrane protein YfcA
MIEIVILCLIGVVAGVASGLLGIGGAVIIIPALTILLGFNEHTAQGTTLLLMIPPIGLLAALEYYKAGYVNLKAAIIIAACFFVGAFFGGKISLKIDETILKKAFAVFLVFIAARMFFSK